MIRPATLSDLEAVINLATQEAKRYTRLKPDHDKIRKGSIEAISSASHFCWVSVDAERKVKGLLLALAGNNLWAQRQHCNIVIWTSLIAGDGAMLLRAFREWIHSRRAVKVAGLCPDLDNIDDRVWLLARRIGFEQQGGAYLLYN